MNALYRSQEIDATDPNKGAISIVGSAPSADALWKAGKPATTWGTVWRDEWTQCLAGRHVVLMPERDEYGWAWARELCLRLYGHAKSIRWIVLPVEEGQGVWWWFNDGGGDVNKLVRLVTATPLLADRLEWDEKEFERVWQVQFPNDCQLS